MDLFHLFLFQLLFFLRTSEINLFYNLQVFYWHFLEILWLFIFLVLYLWFLKEILLFCIFFVLHYLLFMFIFLIFVSSSFEVSSEIFPFVQIISWALIINLFLLVSFDNKTSSELFFSFLFFIQIIFL